MTDTLHTDTPDPVALLCAIASGLRIIAHAEPAAVPRDLSGLDGAAGALDGLAGVFAAAERFRQALIDAAVAAEIYRAEHEQDPRQCLADVIAWHAANAVREFVDDQGQPDLGLGCATILAKLNAATAEVGRVRALLALHGIDAPNPQEPTA